MIIVLMGVAGSGKTFIGQKLAKALGCPFYDSDDYHTPAHKEKMKSGIGLTDEDRQPWLQTLVEEMKKWNSRDGLCVLACSALKQKYRDQLSKDGPLRWVYLKGDRELIQQRLEARQGHFADAKLLESQFAALEEPHDAMVVDAADQADKIVESLAKKLKEI